MHFTSREQAGRMLAKRIAKKYAGEPCAVIAISDGSVMVGVQIAVQLQCSISLLVMEYIDLPGEQIPIGGVIQDGSFLFNTSYNSGEIYQLAGEYHGIIEQAKQQKMRQIHDSIGNKKLIDLSLFKDRNVILVSDGLTDGLVLSLTRQYLKPVDMRRLIVATPLATVNAVDQLHIAADDIFCINILDGNLPIEHYYDTPDIPSHDVVVKAISQVVENWTKPKAV